jgi:hypothetical protein
MSNTIYYGWIDARVASRAELTTLGVKGPKLYNKNDHAYIDCRITEDMVPSLVNKSKHFHAGAFTAVNDNGNQLPRDQQKLWGK